MGKLQEVLDKILNRAADEEPQVEDEGDAEGEALTRIIEAFQVVSADTEKIVQAIQLLDTNLEEVRALVGQHATVLAGLAKEEVEKVHDMVNQGDWFKSLHVASRDAEPVTEAEAEKLQEQLTPVTPGGDGGLLDPVMFPTG